MSEQMAPETYLQKIQNLLQQIRKLYVSKMSDPNKEILQKFERVYQYIFNQYTSQVLSSDDLFGIYGYFLQTIKRYKRTVENAIKFNYSDYQSFKEKYTSHGIQLLPFIQNDLKLDFSQKSLQFSTNESNTYQLRLPKHHIYTNSELCDVAVNIFDYLKVFEQFKIDRDILKQLIQEICLHYNIIPYHNFTHAFQLFQLLFTCYERSALREFVNPVEIFSALLSALAHDLNHKGVNNAYKIKKSQKRNVITSEQAVLENMHCATFFNLLHQNKKLDVIEVFQDANVKNNIKRLIITSILATDMSKHNKLVAKLTKRVEATQKLKELKANGEEPSELVNFLSLKSENIEDRRFILNILVHACDISNPVMDFDLYMNWSYLLAQEFQDQVYQKILKKLNQTIKEAENGLEVLAFLKYKDMPTYYGGQMFFSKQMAFPLWKQIGEFFPQLKFLPDQLEKNLLRIEEEKKKVAN